MDDIGKKLKKLRGDKSIGEVANAIGVAPSTISMYENGERVPRDSIKIKLAQYYNLSIEELFFAHK